LQAIRHQNNSGQVMAEFAIAFPVQLLLTLGILQLALVFTAKHMVGYAAFTAARSLLCEPSMSPEDATEAAALTCVPITGPSHSGTVAVDMQDTIAVPGWGRLARSALSKRKTTVCQFDFSSGTWSQLNNTDIVNIFNEVSLPALSGDSNRVAVAVVHDFELILPVVNGFFRLFTPAWSSNRWGVPHITIAETCILAKPWETSPT